MMTMTTRNDGGGEMGEMTTNMMMSHRCYITCSLVVMISGGVIFTITNIMLSVMKV